MSTRSEELLQLENLVVNVSSIKLSLKSLWKIKKIKINEVGKIIIINGNNEKIKNNIFFNFA